MKRKRRTFSAEFKTRVALEALKASKSINQIVQVEGVRLVKSFAAFFNLGENFSCASNPSTIANASDEIL